jgi:hypothetical protein
MLYTEYGGNMRSNRRQFTDARGNAKRRGIDFTLSEEQFLELRAAPCVYGTSTEPAEGIDRIVSEQGYTAENTSPCCPRHNMIKNKVFNREDMLRLVREFSCAAACGKTRKTEGRAKAWKGLRKQGRQTEVKRRDRRYDV